MAFGLNSKFTQEEKIQISLKKSLKKLSQKQMTEDLLFAQKAKAEALKQIKNYRLSKQDEKPKTETVKTSQDAQPPAQEQPQANELFEANAKTEANENLNAAITQTENQTDAEAEKGKEKINDTLPPQTDDKTKSEGKKSFWQDLFLKISININQKFYLLKKKILLRKKVLGFAAGAVVLAAIFVAVSNFIVCYDIFFDGHHIGIVDNLKTFNDVLDELQNDLREDYGMDSLYFERNVVYKKLAVFKRDEVLSRDEIYLAAKSSDVPLFCLGAVITVDGEDTIKLSSISEAKQAVSKFEDFCKNSEGEGITVVSSDSFSTDKEIDVKEKIITIGSNSTSDEAASYLASLVKNAAYAMEPELDEKTLQIAFSDIISDEDKIEVTFYDAALHGAGPLFDKALSASANANLVSSGDEKESGAPSLTTALVFRADLSDKDDVDKDIKLNVTTTREIEYVKEVAYSREEYYSSEYYVGEVVVTTPGVNGQTKVRSIVTATNGIVSNEKVINENVITEPVTEMVANGTKDLPEAYSTGKFMIPATGDITATNKAGSHAGFKAVDIANSEGTGIYASDSGVVSLAGWYSDYGYCIIINHSDGYQTLYGHLSYIGVSIGQSVEKGENIGRMGSTGNSTGPHLHFEIRLNGVREYIPAYFDNMWYGNRVYAFQ